MSEANPAPSFEKALEQLESLVKEMESGQLPLAGMVEKFEEGSKIIAMCEARLKEAELKIETLQEIAGSSDPTPPSPQ